MGWRVKADEGSASGRFLQPDQPPLRFYNRVLRAANMPRDEGNR